MAIRGRKKGQSNGNGKGQDNCLYCEGTSRHFGGVCGACDGNGSEKTRRQLQKVYNSKKGLPINQNITDKTQ